MLRRWGDERLADRVGDGDERAFAALYERYHQPLFRYCRSILRDDVEAQDALQSTFERAFAALSERRRNAPLRPWLFRIAHNEAISLIRRRGASEPEPAEIVAFAASAEHEAAERARLATLMDDLADLPARPRSALVMRELSDLSHEEIAAALSITPAAAKQAIFEARRALQEAVEGRAMACEEIRRKLSDGDGRALRGRRLRAHLRDCAGCAAFAAAIPERQVQLRALVPALPPAAAATILARALGASGTHGAAGTGLGAGAAGTGVVGKGVATAALSSKLAIGAAVLVTAAGAGGVAAVVRLVHHVPPPARPSASSAPARATASGSVASSRVASTSGAARSAAAPAARSGDRAGRDRRHGASTGTHPRHGRDDRAAASTAGRDLAATRAAGLPAGTVSAATVSAGALSSAREHDHTQPAGAHERTPNTREHQPSSGVHRHRRPVILHGRPQQGGPATGPPTRIPHGGSGPAARGTAAGAPAAVPPSRAGSGRPVR